MREFDESKTVSEGFSTTDEYLEMLEAAIESSEIGYLIADSDCNVIKSGSNRYHGTECCI